MIGYFGTLSILALGILGLGILSLGILSCHPPKEMPMKLKNYYKNNQFYILRHNFLIFLDTQLHEPKISEETIPDFLGNGVFLAAKIRKLHLVSSISVSNSNW